MNVAVKPDTTPDERAPGPTFDTDRILYVDFETRGALPITVGTDRYARHAEAIMLAWAFGEGPVHIEAVDNFDDGPLRWDGLTYEFRKFFDDAIALCAHNAGFDRAVWQHSTVGFPSISLDWWIDTRAQATASGLPAALEWAAKYTGTDVLKDKAGKKLIKLFTLPTSEATPQTHPEEWQRFKDYAAQDVAAMRSLFKRTRQLPLAEWREFWVSEAINDRGIGIDVDLARAAASMAEVDKKLSARELADLTSNAVTSVNQVARINEWLMALLPNDGREILITVTKETDDDGAVTREQETSLERKRIERLLAYLDTLKPLSERLQAAERVLQIRLYGGSKTPAKFGKMVDSQVDGIIRGQYVFGGASQTGRYSARGIQVHNLMRDAAPYEIDAIDALLAGVDIATFARLGEYTPVSRKLSLLIRPTLVAQPGHAFVWGDWANIEARVLPWLARDREADERLGVFRDVDDGTEKYDIYIRTAAEISGLPLDQVDKKIRQRGKVVELACVGFGTEVLTDRGYVEIQNVRRQDRVWDGIEWVGHHGLVQRGDREVLKVSGALLTPGHLILCGTQWLPAQDVTQSENTFCRALATASVSFPSPGSSLVTTKVLRQLSSSVIAGLRSTLSRSTASAKEALCAVMIALVNSKSPLEKCTGSMRLSVPPTSTGVGFLIGSQRASIDARTRNHPSTATTAVAGFEFIRLGLRKAASETNQSGDRNSCGMSSALRAGMTQLSNWIVSTLTATTSRAICVLSRALKTCVTDETSKISKHASPNSKLKSPTYDLAFAGPRNRYTIRTDRGPLIVHNCGFGGGTNALLNMAAGYRMHLTEDEAWQAVQRWRRANEWAPRFWAELWQAAENAVRHPKRLYEAGRVTYVYLPDYLGGSLLCELPSGRFLTYRLARWEYVDVTDEETGEVIDRKREFRFSRDMGRLTLWPGLLCENIVQATAADILRGTLTRLADMRHAELMPVRLHTHDEVLVECSERDAVQTARILRNIMVEGFDWSAGLPIAADTVVGRWYSKSENSWGL